MKLERLLEIPGTACVRPAPEGTEIFAACSSDLFGDVMAHAAETSVRITIQAHQNAVAVHPLLANPR